MQKEADQISIYPSKKNFLLEGNAQISDFGSGTVHGQILTLDVDNRQIRTEVSECQRSLGQ
jgi:hypothetical protein